MSYTTEQFDKDVAGLRALIKMCDDLERDQNIKGLGMKYFLLKKK